MKDKSPKFCISVSIHRTGVSAGRGRAMWAAVRRTVHLLALLTWRYRGACALIVQRLQRRYGEAKRGREGIEEFGDRVAKGVEREQLGTLSDRPGDDRLTEDDFALGEASLSKDRCSQR